MSLLDKIKPEQKPDHSLDKYEIELLLNLIKESKFLGEHIEVLYRLVLKLQQQYLEK